MGSQFLRHPCQATKAANANVMMIAPACTPDSEKGVKSSTLSGTSVANQYLENVNGINQSMWIEYGPELRLATSVMFSATKIIEGMKSGSVLRRYGRAHNSA